LGLKYNKNKSSEQAAISMRPKMRKIILPLTTMILLSLSLLPAAAEQRTALVIGNSTYTSAPLKNPVNDAAAIADMLRKLGFSVTLKKNAGLQEMDEAIREFGRQLKRVRGVGLFYYAGHGMQINGINYLVPVNARIERESDVRFQSINADMLLAEMENAENGLNIVLLDACRDNPFSRSFRNAARGLAIISDAPSGTFISYSTGANQVARDGDGTNSPYTRALLGNMDKPGLSINNVFMRVRSRFKQETGQIPWELSSLEGDFFFVPRAGKTPADTGSDHKIMLDTDKSSAPAADTIDNEREKIAAEKQRLAREEALLADKLALEERRRQLEEKKQRLALGARPAAVVPNEIKRDGRFIAYDNGTVLDTKTSLMWAAMDNGSDIKLEDAKKYCENYRGGGYADWRLPTQDELADLHDGAIDGNNDYHLTTLITLTACCPWVAGGSEAANFNFSFGIRNWHSQAWGEFYPRVISVRDTK